MNDSSLFFPQAIRKQKQHFMETFIGFLLVINYITNSQIKNHSTRETQLIQLICQVFDYCVFQILQNFFIIYLFFGEGDGWH